MNVRFVEKDMGWERIVKDLKGMKNAYTDVGLFGHGGTPENDVAARGVVHEFGSQKRNIPSRPFTRTAFDRNVNELKKAIVILYNNMLKGKLSPLTLLSSIGEWMGGKIKRGITEYQWKALLLSTIKRKKSSQPLIDTAVMRNTITHKETLK